MTGLPLGDAGRPRHPSNDSSDPPLGASGGDVQDLATTAIRAITEHRWERAAEILVQQLTAMDRQGQLPDAAEDWAAPLLSLLTSGRTDEFNQLLPAILKNLVAEDEIDLAIEVSDYAEAIDPRHDLPTRLNRLEPLIDVGAGGLFAEELDEARPRASGATAARLDMLRAKVAFTLDQEALADQLMGDAAEVLRELGDWHEAGEITQDRAELVRDLGDHHRAIALFLEAAALYSRAAAAATAPTDDASDADCLYLAANLLIANGDGNQAADLYLRAAARYEQVSRGQDAAIALNQASQAAPRPSDAVTNRHHWQEALRLAPTGPVAVVTWLAIAEDHRDTGDFAAATIALDRAENLDVDGVHHVDITLQRYWMQEERDPDGVDAPSLDAFRDAIIDERPVEAAVCDMLLALDAERRGQRESAERRWIAAEHALLTQQRSDLLAQLHIKRAEVALVVNTDPEAARDQFAQARPHAERAGQLALVDHIDLHLRQLSMATVLGPGEGLRARPGDLGIQVTDRRRAYLELSRARVEFGLGRGAAARDHALAAGAYFTQQDMPQPAAEARCLAALGALRKGAVEQAAFEISALLATPPTPSTARFRGVALFASFELQLRRGDHVAARASLQTAEALFTSIGDPGMLAISRLNLGVLDAHVGHPEDALQLLGAANATFRSTGMRMFALRCDIAAAVALRRLDQRSVALDLAMVAVLTMELLRSQHPSSRDRADWRASNTAALDLLADLTAEDPDPHRDSSLIERLRANTTSGTTARVADGTAHVDGPPAAWVVTYPLLGTTVGADERRGGEAATWSTAMALLDDFEAIPIGPPPLLRMPWGVALQEWEAAAEHRAELDPSAPGRATVAWEDQLRFL